MTIVDQYRTPGGKLHVPPTEAILQMEPLELDQLELALMAAKIDTEAQIGYLRSEGQSPLAAAHALSHFNRGLAAVNRANNWYDDEDAVTPTSATIAELLSQLSDAITAHQALYVAVKKDDVEKIKHAIDLIEGNPS